MLTLVIPSNGASSDIKVVLEHSLVSLSKWESLHEKAFYGKEEKSLEETQSYITQMIVSPDPPSDLVSKLQSTHYKSITDYINSKQTATTFNDREPKRGQPEAITSELIYYWLVSFNIPFDPCETWHLNRLMTLIRVAGVKSAPPKKMTRQQIAEQQRRLNEERRNKLNTNG